MDTRELRAFEQECQACEETFGAVPDDAWARPGLGDWTIAELGAHLLRAATRVDEYLDLPVDEGAPQVDRVAYWRYDADAEAPAIAERARAQAAGVDARDLPRLFGAGWRRSSMRARTLPPDRLLATVQGVMRLDEYLATRVVEVVVHHLDLRRALELPPAATPDASRMTMEVLEALFGSPRPRNLGRERFILTATGRIASEDRRFPVLR